MRSNWPDPISCRASSGRRSGHIKRYVVRRIGQQAQREKKSDAKADKSDKLIDAFIFGRRQDAHKLPLYIENPGRGRFELLKLRFRYAAQFTSGAIADRGANNGEGSRVTAGRRGRYRAKPSGRNASNKTTIPNKIR